MFVKIKLTFLLIFLCPFIAVAQTQHDRLAARGQSTFDSIANTATVSLTGATPSVALGNVFITANGGPTTITNLTGGHDAQTITIFCGETNTTFANNANIVISNGSNYVCVLNSQISFTFVSSIGKWTQISGGTAAIGTVTSVGLTVPSWLSVANSPVTGAGTLAVTPATAQTSHQVIGTCGSATTFTPCLLVAGDIPTGIPIANVGTSGLSGTAPVTISAAGAIACATCNTSAAVANPPLDRTATGLGNPTADATFTYPIASTTGLTLAGTAPASVSTSTGTNATSLFNVNGVTGGADSNATGTAGIGSSPSITAGNGGAGTGTNAVGGAGGSLTISAGNGGASLGTGANANGGNIFLYAGSAGSGGSGAAGNLGTVSTNSLNNIIFLDGVKYAQSAAGLNAALVAAGSTKEVWVPSNASTFTDAVIVLQKGSVLKFMGGNTSAAGVTYTIGPASGSFTTTPAIQLPDSTTDASATARIECVGAAKILLAAGSNRDMINNASFYTNQGSANTFGTYRFNITGCLLDGNRANQAALVTRTVGTISNLARSAGGVVTVNFSNSPSMVVGDTCEIAPSAPATNASFINRAIVISSTATQITYNGLGATIAQFANTGSVTCYSGPSNIRVYGRDIQFINLYNASAVLDGHDTSGAQIVVPATINDDTGCFMRGVRSMNHGGDGWWFDGPDTCSAVDTKEWGNSQWAREATRAGLVDTVHYSYNTPTQTGGLGGLWIHGASVQTSANQETCQITNCTGILVDYNGGSNTFSSMLVGAGPGGTAAIGMEVRSAGQSFEGTMQSTGTGSTVLKLNQGSGVFDITVTPSGANTGATIFDIASASLPPLIFMHKVDTVDTLFAAGSPVGNETLLGAGFTNQIIASGSGALISGAIKSYNGNGFTAYSDAGVTVQASISGANGTVRGSNFQPLNAGGAAFGTAAVPSGSIFLGTAATNNFAFTPAATSAARTVNILDPGVATVNLALLGGTTANGNVPNTWNWAQTTDAQDAMTFGETSAATGGTLTNLLANQAELHVSTASGSTAAPLEVEQAGVTATTGPPIAQFESTWNNASLVGQGIVENVTNTSSATGSLLINLRVGNATQFSVDKAGNVAIPTGAAIAWNADTGLSRLAAASVGVGNGTNGSVTGNVTATSFTTATATPATAGVVRVASADSLACFRNNANGANDCIVKSGAVSGGISADSLDLTQFGMEKITGRVMSVGTVTTCAFTSGGGTSPSCAIDTGSTDFEGIITLSSGTGTPAALGTATLTFSATYGTNKPSCVYTLSDNGTGAWNARATIIDATPSTGSDIFNWDNNGATLALSSTWKINYFCGAK